MKYLIKEKIIYLRVNKWRVLIMWYKESVFYQIYPLGFCNAPLENDGKEVNRIF